MSLRSRAWLVSVGVVLAGCGAGPSVTSTSGSISPPSMATSLPSPTTAPSTSTTSSTTTSLPSACPPEVAIGALERAVAAARLATVEDPWTTDTSGSLYVDAVVQPERFAQSLGFRCSLRVVQAVGTGLERLGLVAWTGDRMGYVVLALDGPATPYADAVRYDLLFEQPWGDWVSDHNIWAATISNGDTVIIGVEDYFPGPVAKSFLIAFPEPTSPPPEIPAEEYAIAVLQDAGMSNVGIAEPSETDVASIAFTTPLGNPMVATVGPVNVFDPFSGYLAGDTKVTVVEGVDVRTTLAGPGQFGVADVSFVCDDYGWRIESSVGSPDEPLAVAEELIATLDCPA